MFENNIDTLLILSPENRFYFSGLNTSLGCVILKDERKVFITDFRYEGYARKKLSSPWEVVITKSVDFYDAISSTLSTVGANVVGYEEESVTVADFRRLRTNCGSVAFEPCSAQIAEQRAVKTEEEISKIAAAQLVAQKALQRVSSSIKIGVTEREVAAELLYEMQMLGAEGASFDTIVAFGENSAVPHHKPTSRKLDRNDVILVDMGAKLDGYCSDMTRTFCLGTPCDELVAIHKVVLEAQEYALANIKADMTGLEADSFAREFIIAHGYGKEFGHNLGHGVGVQIHEKPCLGPNSNDILKPNMIITVEPGIYIEGVGGVRIEDFAVVKEDGLINLTNFNKNLIL